MSSETTYVMVKPDGVQRSLVGEIIQRFERKGLQLVGLKQIIPTEDIAKKHYDVHSDKPFFPGLIKFITSGPVVCMAWSGKDAISVARNLIGPTNGREASPGTIRGDFYKGGDKSEWNLIHGSDSPEAAAKEIGLFFTNEEIHSWTWGPLPGETA